MVQSSRAQRTLLICIHRWKRPRTRRRRLCTSSTDPKRPQGHLRAANGQDFTTSAAPLHGESDRARRRFRRGSQKEVHGYAPTQRRRRAIQEKATALEGHPPKRHPSRRSLRSRGSPVRSRPSVPPARRWRRASELHALASTRRASELATRSRANDVESDNPSIDRLHEPSNHNKSTTTQFPRGPRH